MKQGYNTLSLLIGMLLSVIVLNLIVTSFRLVSNVSLINENQDYLSSVQIYAILSHSTNIEVNDNQITFIYLNEQRELIYKNNKLIMTPGTVIYYTNISDLNFNVADSMIVLTINKSGVLRKFKIGTYE